MHSKRISYSIEKKNYKVQRTTSSKKKSKNYKIFVPNLLVESIVAEKGLAPIERSVKVGLVVEAESVRVGSIMTELARADSEINMGLEVAGSIRGASVGAPLCSHLGSFSSSKKSSFIPEK